MFDLGELKCFMAQVFHGLTISMCACVRRDLEKVVAFAADRAIRVIPEIE